MRRIAARTRRITPSALCLIVGGAAVLATAAAGPAAFASTATSHAETPSAAAPSTVTQSAATPSAAAPSAAALLGRSIAALAKQPAIAGTETENGTTLRYLVEPQRKATQDEIIFSSRGHTGQLDIIVTAGSLYLKGNAEGFAFITLGLIPAAQLAHLVGRWYKTSSASLSFAVPSFTPTLAGIGTLLCLNRTALSASGTSLSGSAACSLAGTVVTRYSATSAVVVSKGLGDETITLTRLRGALLPTKIVSSKKGKSTDLTVNYPSAAPKISPPARASALPSTL